MPSPLCRQIAGVDHFVGQVNSALRQRHEQERLKEILSRIESYEAVEAKDEEVEKLVRSHCDLDLTRPMPLCSDHQRRHLLIEGDLKLRDQVGPFPFLWRYLISYPDIYLLID